MADGVLFHESGKVIICEVKSAPLVTYPIIFANPTLAGNTKAHTKVNITLSQLRNMDSALYLHDNNIIPLGKVGQDLWPFRQMADFILSRDNVDIINDMTTSWINMKKAYVNKDKESKYYYLTNACGTPPRAAKAKDSWPDRESISDSKTSAGMDRTDDIKKAIYQVLKIGSSTTNSMKTAIVSNLPAYRHYSEYVEPFINMLWFMEHDAIIQRDALSVSTDKIRRVFDYIITIDQPILRELEI